MPKVSVIIPAYNSAQYVGEAVESALAQTYKDHEIIVVDDGSTDNTKEVLSPYTSRIKYFFQENRGAPAARNFGISRSRGRYVAFLDADDLWLPDKLEKQVMALESNPHLAFVSSGTYAVNAQNQIIGVWNKNPQIKENFGNLLENNFIYILTVVVRRDCLDKVGGFDERLFPSDDYDLWLRLAKRYPFGYIDAPLAKYRIHQNNSCKNVPKKISSYRLLFKKTEIWGGVSFLKKHIRLAKVYYFAARSFHLSQNFLMAAKYYLIAILTFPFIGYYFWPPEAESFRFSFLYRILKPYATVMVCLKAKMGVLKKRVTE